MTDDASPTAICHGCGQRTFGDKFPELTIDYDGETTTTRMCRDCVGSPLAVVKSLKGDGNVEG